MDILFFSNIPSPYSIAYINELGKLANVIAVYEKQSFKHRDSSCKSFSAANIRKKNSYNEGTASGQNI